MVPCAFDGENVLLDPPPGIDVAPLNAAVMQKDGINLLVSCWKPTQADLAALQRGGRLWLTMIGPRSVPPVMLTTERPFDIEAQDDG